jgi:hypothetical protein
MTSADQSPAGSERVQSRRATALDPQHPRIAVCLLGPCSDRSHFRATAEAILRQDYGGDVVLLVPDGAAAENEWRHIRRDGSRELVLSPYVDATLALDCNEALAMALALHPPAEFLALLRCGERPPKGWLESLRRAQEEFDADLVTGPVKAVFDDRPADWMIASGFFDRLGLRRGLVARLPAPDNSMIRATAVRSLLPLVLQDPAPHGSEWTDLAFRAQALGFVAAWANDAVVFDAISRSRMNEQSLIDGGYWAAYAVARAQRVYGASRLANMLLGIRAFGLLLAGLACCAVFGRDGSRSLRGRLMLARARGTLDGCAAREQCERQAT